MSIQELQAKKAEIAVQKFPTPNEQKLIDLLLDMEDFLDKIPGAADLCSRVSEMSRDIREPFINKLGIALRTADIDRQIEKLGL